MAFPPQQLVRLSRLYSVTRASSVLTGSATRRWGWCLGRRGYISSQGVSHHFPLDPNFTNIKLQNSRWKFRWFKHFNHQVTEHSTATEATRTIIKHDSTTHSAHFLLLMGGFSSLRSVQECNKMVTVTVRSRQSTRCNPSYPWNTVYVKFTGRQF